MLFSMSQVQWIKLDNLTTLNLTHLFHLWKHCFPCFSYFNYNLTIYSRAIVLFTGGDACINTLRGKYSIKTNEPALVAWFSFCFLVPWENSTRQDKSDSSQAIRDKKRRLAQIVCLDCETATKISFYIMSVIWKNITRYEYL